MAQHDRIVQTPPRYTRADFMALRAFLNRLPIDQISSRYYGEDEAMDPAALRARLIRLRDRLIAQAELSNPHLADVLRRARESHVWSARLASFLLTLGEQDTALPTPGDPLGTWIMPRAARTLNAAGMRTLGDLVDWIGHRGRHWWKPIPRIGAQKAARLEHWLRQHEATLGRLPNEEAPEKASESRTVAWNTATGPAFVDIPHVRLPQVLDGSQGRNRHAGFCLISARDDKAALEAYLYKFRDQEKTFRAYQKELERFLMWCLLERGIPLSSVLLEDCEAYKDFLNHLPAHWIGPRSTRRGSDWRPFAGPLSSASQRYAVQVLKFFFAWLVDVRYLAGNPWTTVSTPRVAQGLPAMQVDKALDDTLWQRLVDEGGLLDSLSRCSNAALQGRYRWRGALAHGPIAAQFRLARAALLLLGDTGIRREEAAYASRDQLKPTSDESGMWELAVLGKRNKWRTVFPSPRTLAALAAHWADRGDDFDDPLCDKPLLSPLMAPATAANLAKHGGPGESRSNGFSPDGLYQMIKRSLRRIACDPELSLSGEERARLLRSGPHAFRHTFGTLAVANEVPLDVVQRVLGHASLQTTTVYVQAEKQRSMRELGRFLGKK